MSDDTHPNPREFVAMAAAMLSASPFGSTRHEGTSAGTGRAASADERASGRHSSFDTPKQIDAGLLSAGYADAGPTDGRAVILLHGWPYDIHSYAHVAPLLATRGYCVIVPYLRGYGTTRFRSSRAFRNAQQSAVALDVIALMDALTIRQAIIGGVDEIDASERLRVTGSGSPAPSPSRAAARREWRTRT